MNKIITCLFVVALSCCIQTTIAQAHNNTDSLTEKFFTLYKTTGPDVALDFLFHTNDYFTKENESVDDVKTKLVRFVKSGGAYHGYDFIIKKNAGPNICMYTYIVKYDVQPLIFRIMFYRPEDKWMLNNFQFTGSIDDEMEEASKISQ